MEFNGSTHTLSSYVRLEMSGVSGRKQQCQRWVTEGRAAPPPALEIKENKNNRPLCGGRAQVTRLLFQMQLRPLRGNSSLGLLARSPGGRLQECSPSPLVIFHPRCGGGLSLNLDADYFKCEKVIRQERKCGDDLFNVINEPQTSLAEEGNKGIV